MPLSYVFKIFISMINKIYNLVHEVAEKHKLIRSFRYDELSKAAGTGEDDCPLVFLEMPIWYGEVGVMQGVVPCTFNVDIVLNPQALENYDIRQLSPLSCQQIASQVAQQMVARMRNLYVAGLSEVNVVNYSIITLQRWYDDASYGVRLTVNANVVNDIAFCSDDDYYDEGKEFSKETLLPNIDTEDAQGCVGLSYKLPKITI